VPIRSVEHCAETSQILQPLRFHHHPQPFQISAPEMQTKHAVQRTSFCFLTTRRNGLPIRSVTASTSSCKPASPACRPDLFTRSGDLAKEGRVAHFIEPMECMPVEKIPEGDVWSYELLCGGPHKISSVVSGIMWRWGCCVAKEGTPTLSYAT
jgi:hypothetical protein